MMMENIREGVKKPWAKIVIFAIVISFAGAGYFTSAFLSGDPFAAAVVNEKSISTQEFQRAYARTKQQYGEAFNQFVKTEEQEKDFRENVLQNLISRTVTLQAVERLGMRISDSQLRKTIQEMTALQNEGVYSSEKLDQALRNIGMTRNEFKQSLSSDLVLGQFSKGISATEFILPIESESDFAILGQKRTGKALTIKYSLFDAGIEITDDEINSYYQENKESFRLEEKISLSYIDLSVENLQKDITVSDEQALEYYNENLDRFVSEEQRRVSHILIASSDEDDELLAKAENIKAKLDAGENFIALVKAESSDDFSAENDGDLGVLAEGDMEESFENAMNALVNVGDISTPVKTSFGYHIIKLTELAPGETQTIADVKEQIITILKKQLAEESFYAKSSVLEEQSFEISDSLNEVSELLGVEIKTSPVFSKNNAVGIFANRDVKLAAFSENVLEASMNSSLINITDNHVVVVRLKTHEASKIELLDNIKEKIVANLKKSKAKEGAVKYGNTINEKLMAGDNFSEMLAAKSLTWKDLDKVERTSSLLPYLQMQSFFKMKQASVEQHSTEMFEDSNDYVLLVLNNIETGNLKMAKDDIVKQTNQQLTRFFSDAIYSSLVEQERNQAEVIRNVDNINR
jgi:peptidyl-prolyl cis-trans isomerase D